LSILSFARTIRGAQRLTEIVQILTKHGFGHIVTRLNLHRQLPVISRLRRKHRPSPAAETETPAKRAAMLLQDLGGTFIKLGQLLSTRPDLLPESFIIELAQLQDHAKPFPGEQSRQTIEAELRLPIHEIFPEFDDNPIASGSIAQVHAAVLADGTPVVVKVKRPGIDRTISTDLDILRALTNLAERYFPEWRVYRPEMMVDELARKIHKELDFLTEAAFTARFREITRDSKTLRSPDVFWKFTSPSVLTLERLSGIKINMVEELKEQGIDPRALARNLTAGFIEHYLEHGMFHADPHPGNLLVSADGRINLIDFGLVGHLSEEMRSQLAATLFAVTRRDIDTFVEVYSEIGVFDRRTHAAELKTDLAELLDKYYGLPLVQIDIKRVFHDAAEAARRHHVMLPRDFVLLGKSFVAVIGTARKLDPEYDLGTLAESTAKLISKERFSPSRIKRLLTTEFWQIGRLLQRLPRDLRNLITSVQEGKLQLVFRHEGLENLTTELDRSSNRLSFSITLAAIIIGSSLIIAAGVGPKVQGISLLGVVGYLLAGVLGAWLVVAILRTGKL